MIPDDIEFFVPGPNDRVDDLPLGCVALNQAVLAAGLRLPFPRMVKKFLREWRIAPTQLCPNGWRILVGFLILWNQLGFSRPSSREFNSLYSFKLDGKMSGWWYASVKVKTGGSVVTQTPDLIKNWKKFLFFVRGPWQFSANDTTPDVNIPVRYHELRYTSHEPTLKSIEKARRARVVDENFYSSSALITEENLATARLSPATSHHPQPRRGKPSSSLAFRPPPSSSQIPPTYLGSTLDRDEEYLKLCGSISKPVCNFFRSNSLTRGDIIELPSSVRRTISVIGKSWTPVQQKYLDSMGIVESIIVASVNTSKIAIQLTSAVEKMGRMLTDIQDILLRREEELRRREAELKALADDLEAATKSRAELEHELEIERKTHAELRTTLEKSVDKDEVVEECKSSDAYLADQEKVYFLTMEELIEATVEKRPDWDVQFLIDELSELKRKSTLNPPSSEEVDQDQSGAEK
ncbi:Plus3 domain-containing protein [Abeliophyllum distichum]|uniref:Plus3 domain-containing protein n=1 Tax=Abeliophyllum distichum TaxID=126358 RepID=A0ABD1TH36_9LAMI